VERERADDVIAGVGRRIAEARRAAGLTQQQAAELLAMPLKNLQAYEAGRNMTLRTLVRIANGFGVRTRTLLSRPRSRRPRSRGRPVKR
jgi:transcriptional regulator with XRE-family HTH domain